LLDLFDDSISAFSGFGKLVFNLGFLVIDFFLLLSLKILHPLLVFLIVSLCLFELRVILEGGSASHLVLKLGFLGVEFFLGFLSLGLHVLHDFLVVDLGLLLDGVELVDGALLGAGVLLLQFGLGLLRLSLLLGGFTLSHELNLVVVSFCSFLNIG